MNYLILVVNSVNNFFFYVDIRFHRFVEEIRNSSGQKALYSG